MFCYVFPGKIGENVDNKNLFSSTYFRSDFRQIRRSSKAGSSKIVEALANLFMKLQTSTVTKLVNQGIKVKIILFQNRILCQFNSIFSEKSYIKKIFEEALVS